MIYCVHFFYFQSESVVICLQLLIAISLCFYISSNSSSTIQHLLGVQKVWRANWHGRAMVWNCIQYWENHHLHNSGLFFIVMCRIVHISLILLFAYVMLPHMWYFLCLQEWVQCAPNENLHLPAPNVFIPTDLSLKGAQQEVWQNIVFWRSFILL